jgi:hypothetical protein
MIGRLALVSAIIAFLLQANGSQAQNLLTNGGLELTPPDDGGRFSVAPGWLTVEGPKVPWLGTTATPGDYNNAGVPVIPCPGLGCGAVDAADWVVYRKFLGTGYDLPNEFTGISPGSVSTADGTHRQIHYGEPPVVSLSEPSNFTHLLFEGDWQHWFQPYNGTESGYEDNFAHLTQTVPGTSGTQYTMSGWALFENYFAGGVTNLNAESGGIPTGAPFNDGALSPTDTFFGLDFLDANGNVLTGSVEVELKANGQPSNTMWHQHTLVGTAPAGTTQVRVRVTMLDGVYNPLPSPEVFQQSFLVDDFSLTAAPGAGSGSTVPEPGTCLIAFGAAAIGACLFRSRHLAN